MRQIEGRVERLFPPSTCLIPAKSSGVGIDCSKLVRTIGSVNISSCSKRSPFSSVPLSLLKKFRMKVRAALGSDAGLNGKRRNGISRALDFNSFVQARISSCISSGSTSFRVQASPSQSGFGGGTGAMAPFVWALAFFFDLGEASPPASLSLLLSFEKNPMANACGGCVRPQVSLMGMVSCDSWVEAVCVTQGYYYFWRPAITRQWPKGGG